MAEIKNIISNGSVVITKIGKIEAIVCGICVRGVDNSSVEYNISYFANGEHKSKWIYSFEIDLKIDNSKKAGFCSNQKLIN